MEYYAKLSDIINEFSLEQIFIPNEEVHITRSDVNRPGLALAGFFTHFESARIQVIGNMEFVDLKELTDKERFFRVEQFLSHCPATLIYSRSLPVHSEMLELAKKYSVPLLRTNLHTSAFMSQLIASLTLSLAPRIVTHGVFVEVYGEGILITGDSGVGKSEAALELLKRGHRMVADDAVEIIRASAKTLVGQATKENRYYSELRGVGIIDIRRLFGMGAVKDSERIEFVANFEQYQDGKEYERLGIETEYTEFLDIKVPVLHIPVLPGRNLAIILEIAAMNHRQKKMGFNAAEEFIQRMDSIMNEKLEEKGK